MPYVKVITETKPANCSLSFRWMFFDSNSDYKNIFEYRKKYYVDTGLILSNTVEFKNSNNQICSSNTATVRVVTVTFANQESCLKWDNDAVRKTFSLEKLEYYKSHNINVTKNT
tara:strand:- start:132 stop:473 length:342 start_codon:yes stop_codon:yes gene_type:complete